MNSPPPEPKVLAVGALPPPVHGMTFVTARVVERLREVSDVRVRDIATGSFRRGWLYHARKLWRVLLAAPALVRHARAGEPRPAFYMPVDGGFGVVYGAALAALARLLGYRRFFHHHNYSYLTRPSRLVRLFSAVAGPATIHIVLCAAMREALVRSYPAVRRTLTLSNAGFTEGGPPVPPSAAGPLTLGHLGNLTVEKGLDTVLDVFDRLLGHGGPARLILAGPLVSERAERIVAAASARHGSEFEHRGPLHGPDKQRFYAEIDVLLFPSRLHEAQPLVIWEALASGVPVIAVRRGCIDWMIGAESGFSVEPAEDFAGAALRRLRHWQQDPDALAAARRSARSRFETARRESLDELNAFLGAVAGAAA